MKLVELVYTATRRFPDDERYGLSSQVRRAAVSVPSNIAEGQGRRSKKEFTQFLSVAHGSLREVETQALLAQRLGYTDDASVASILDSAAEVGRLITGLINSLERN